LGPNLGLKRDEQFYHLSACPFSGASSFDGPPGPT
jgi:hypothetical protein